MRFTTSAADSPLTPHLGEGERYSPESLQRNRSRRLIIQGVLSVLIALFVAYMIDRATEVDLGFDFLSGAGGFAISDQWITNYESSDTRWDAYVVGIVRLILIGIVLAMLLGTVMELARLSSNWLVSTIASSTWRPSATSLCCSRSFSCT